jgi:addiction module HigA family antidote
MSIQRTDLNRTDFSDIASGERLVPVHPGDVLLHDFIEPLGITRYRVAKGIGVSQRRVDEICMSKRAVTAETALRLALFFDMEAQFWLNLQAQYDLETTSQTMGERLEKEVMPLSQAA